MGNEFPRPPLEVEATQREEIMNKYLKLALCAGVASLVSTAAMAAGMTVGFSQIGCDQHGHVRCDADQSAVECAVHVRA